MEYKGYIGTVEWSEEDKCFHGKVLFIRDLVIYEGKNLEELKHDFEIAVDDYVNFFVDDYDFRRCMR